MHEETKKKAKLLLEQYQNGTASPEEEKIIRSWFNQYKTTNQIKKLPADPRPELYPRTLQDTQTTPRKKPTPRLWKYTTAAAVIIAMTILAAVYIDNPSRPGEQDPLTLENDVLPGGNEAQLMLEDGSMLQLNNSHQEDYHIHGIQIDREQGIISFADYSPNSTNSTHINTIKTENGGQYTIILPDGSIVKLNANSSLQFPSVFGETRQVHLDGEAYFNVKRNESVRFIVETGFQKVEVLGTQFNVKSYRDEKITTTALVSGSVKISSKNNLDNKILILNPGYMARNGLDNELKLEPVKTDKIKAWREGEFYFDGENLEEIMTVLARWYNIKVTYEYQPAKNIRYGGIISRDKRLSTVLNLLEEKENLKFEIKGKEVIVKK